MRSAGANGFALMELITAFFVLAVGISAAMYMIYAASESGKAATEAAIALRALENELETLRVTPATDLREGVQDFRSVTPELDRLVAHRESVAIRPGPYGLREISASVGWRTQNGRWTERALTLYRGAD